MLSTPLSFKKIELILDVQRIKKSSINAPNKSSYFSVHFEVYHFKNSTKELDRQRKAINILVWS